MTGAALLAGAAAGTGLLLAGTPRARLPTAVGATHAPTSDGWLRRGRLVWALLAWIGVLVIVTGMAGLVLGAGAAMAVWVVAGRSEPPSRRRARLDVARELPALVLLLAAALRSGSPSGEAVRLVCRAFPGAAADCLTEVPRRLAVGVDPARVWADLAARPELAALGRTLARAHETGAPVAVAVQRLADDLGREVRSGAEDRARGVGVRAALPLGLCLLPSFLLLGIVPLVAGLAAGLDW